MLRRLIHLILAVLTIHTATESLMPTTTQKLGTAALALAVVVLIVDVVVVTVNVVAMSQLAALAAIL